MTHALVENVYFQLQMTHAIKNFNSHLKCQVAHNFQLHAMGYIWHGIYNIIIHFHLLYSWKASCIYEMQLCATKMNPFYIVTHCVYGFNKLFHDIWQF
jgi:hypothetical protein